MRISDWSSDVCSSDLLLARQLGEPAFDLVDPGRRSWCEVHMPMRAAGKPCLDLRRLVGGIIVHHEVDVRPLGHLGVDPPEEVEELGRPMALVAFSDHGAGGDIERGEQRSEEHTSELQSLMRISYAVFCLKKKNKKNE